MMASDSPRMPEAAQPGLVGAPDKERPDAREDAPHVHKWEPVGTVTEQHRFYDGITNPLALVTLAVRSCECGALRRTEVARRYL